MATLKTEIGKPNQEGESKVYIVITHARTRKRIPTLLTVTQRDLSRKTNKITTPYIKDQVDSLLTDYRKRINSLQLELTAEVITAEEIYERITHKTAILDFFAFTEQWLTTQGREKDNYRTMLNTLERYLGKRNLPFSHITYSFLNGFSNWLSDRPRAQTHYLGLIRHVHNLARKTYNNEHETLISANAIEQFPFPKQIQKGGRALDIDTLVRIYNYKPRYVRDSLAKDCALLSLFLMGMNSVDMLFAKTYKDGKICYNRQKTKGRRSDEAYIEVVVDERVKPLVEKYSDDARVFRFHRKYRDRLDFSQNLSKGLRIIKDKINEDIEKENKENKIHIPTLSVLQFYQFRHSVATIMRNDLDIDKSTINDLLCHVDETMRITDVYIKKDFSQINKANKVFLDYFFEKVNGIYRSSQQT